MATQLEKRVLRLKRSVTAAGWIGCAPQGGSSVFALVERVAGGKPRLHWTANEPWAEPARTLKRLERSRALAQHRRVALLQRGQYQSMTMDAPAEVPRPEWAGAVRWQLRDAVEFAVDSAAVDVLAVPEGTSYRPTPQLIAVAASEAEMRALAAPAVEVGLPWDAVDVPECALRNLSLLVAHEHSAQALLHCHPRHATLVVTCRGELLSARHLDLALPGMAAEHEDVRRAAFDHAGLELQRTLDGIERAYGQVTLSQLLITPMPGVQALCDHLQPLMYVTVAPLDLGALLDGEAVATLLADPASLDGALLAIGAALRDD